MTTFSDLGVPAPLCDALADQGITEPFAIQELTIGDALAGRNICGKAKTGSGKTLAFSLPMLALTPRSADGHPTTLMLTPTRELANQIATVVEPLAKSADLRSIAAYGGTNLDRQVELLSGGMDVVIATPGRLIDLIDRRAIDVSGIERVVVDEADRMADMGFLPQVEWVLRRINGQHQTLLFSATLDGVVDTLVKRYLRDPIFHEVTEREVTVSEMGHLFLSVHKMDRVRVAARIIEANGRTLLFTRTKRGADQLTRELRDADVRAGAIHGDLPQVKRERALASFARGKLTALVATDVAARGLHIDEVDVVVHFNPPPEHKTYLHRSGRTARAGRSGTAVTLFLWDEELDVRQLQRRLGLRLRLHDVFSNDERLDDVAAFAASSDNHSP
ncbi:DEAD/DEAH box helicase [Candidatus Poriferisodalis sp.]|uniref:DEAD/DEAH box helicase n=1 Tax=Candidatus Poriferisodalis sp. TaxID=3101277 RepID=UPI003B0103C8